MLWITDKTRHSYDDYLDSSTKEIDLRIAFERKHPLELVLFCGSPGSGKSSYFWKNLQPLGYERVNQDILKSVR